MLAIIILSGCTATKDTDTTVVVPTWDTGAEKVQVAVDTDKTGWDVAAPAQNIAELATCMTEKWLKMYGTERCSHCKDQKALFGDNFASVDYIDCDASKPACVAAGVQWFPTWVDTDGNLYPGTQSLEKLAAISQC